MTAVELSSKTGRGIVAAAVLGSGMAMLDGTIVNVALVRIGEDLNASLADLQWVSNGYLLDSAQLARLLSFIDSKPQAKIFVIGVIGFAVTAFCRFAQNPDSYPRPSSRAPRPRC